MESPKLFGRWGTTRSYGPYGKSYASSSCDSDFESDNSSTESDIPDEYWPYSDEEYSESVITDFDQMNFEDCNSIDSFDIGSNDTMTENKEDLIDHEFEEKGKIQVLSQIFHIFQNRFRLFCNRNSLFCLIIK